MQQLARPQSLTLANDRSESPKKLRFRYVRSLAVQTAIASFERDRLSASNFLDGLIFTLGDVVERCAVVLQPWFFHFPESFA
ncbi:MAG: hypothetical protein HYY77_03715 [Betaproteobacteria bacterium]|nr:hypothetical protein [Betaproteobacteria bacterium]